jgi:hypothetical protein
VKRRGQWDSDHASRLPSAPDSNARRHYQPHTSTAGRGLIPGIANDAPLSEVEKREREIIVQRLWQWRRLLKFVPEKISAIPGGE